MPLAARAACAEAGLAFRDGVHAATHAVLNVLPLLVTCDPHDVGAECDNPYDSRYRPERLLMFDKHPGGIGLAVQVSPRASLAWGCGNASAREGLRSALGDEPYASLGGSLRRARTVCSSREHNSCESHVDPCCTLRLRRRPCSTSCSSARWRWSRAAPAASPRAAPCARSTSAARTTTRCVIARTSPALPAARLLPGRVGHARVEAQSTQRRTDVTMLPAAGEKPRCCCAQQQARTRRER